MTLTFEQWKAKVNEYVETKVGLSTDDLPDANYYDMWESNVSPSEAALEVLEEEGFVVD